MILHKPLVSERNPFGPRADRLAIAYAVDESSSSLNNLGLGYPVVIPATGSNNFDANIFDSSNTLDDGRWFLHQDEDSYIYLGSSEFTGLDSYYVRVYENSTGSDVVFYRGSLFLRFSFQNISTTLDQPIFNTGGDETKSNRLYIFYDHVESKIRIHFNDSSATSSGQQHHLSFNVNIENEQIFSLVCIWGELGLNAWLNGVEADLDQIPGPIFSSDPYFLDPRTDGNPITMDYWTVANGDSIRISRDDSTTYGDMNLYAFCLWDVQLKSVEREELFCDGYISFRSRAKDYSGSSVYELFRTDVNPIAVRPRLSDTSDEVTFSLVTSEILPFTVYFRVNYSTDANMQSWSTSQSVETDLTNCQFNLVLMGLSHATTYYFVAEYSVDNSNWYAFPGGKSKFKTQKRVNSPFNFAFLSDDIIGSNDYGGPPLDFGGSYSGYIGYGGDILRWIDTNNLSNFEGNKHWMVWKAIYDIYVNQDVDFIIVGGDFYCPNNTSVYSPDTNSVNNSERLAQSWRNWFNLLYKCGVCFYVLGEKECEAGYFQRLNNGDFYSTQLRSTIARKKFFPNPTNETYLQGGENETPHTGVRDWIPPEGNNWVPEINTTSESGQIVYDQSYRDAYILGFFDDDPYEDPYVSVDTYQLNRSPLENYYGFTWGNALFCVLDVFRYTEPGDSKNTSGSSHRDGPNWILGVAQKTWLQSKLANSHEPFKFVCCHHLPGGAAITIDGDYSTGGQWYGRGSGSHIKSSLGVNGVNVYYDGSQKEESTEEIEIHNFMRLYNVTALIKGHDKKFCHVIKEEMNYISVTSPSDTHFETDGMRNVFGNTEDQDSQPITATSLGIQVTTNTNGYCLFQYSEGQWILSNRISSFFPHSGDSLLVQDYSNIRLGGKSGNDGPGWAGPIYTPDSSNQVNLSEVPSDIYTICLESDGVFSGDNESNIWSFASGINTGLNLHSMNDWEEFYNSKNISLDGSSVTQDVRITHVPMSIFSRQLLNSIDEDNVPTSLHNISPDSVLFIYNVNVSGSLEVAQYYREKRNMPTSNLIGLSMSVPISSSCETPISKSEFVSTILNPLRNIVSSQSSSGGSGGGYETTTIILGYGTPLTYLEDDGEIIAIASRLHRLNHDYESKKPNYRYNIRNFEFFNSEDTEEVFITAIIDGPTVAAAKKIIDRGIDVSNQLKITGKLMVDPYGLRFSSEDMQYENDILEFLDQYADNLGLTISKTTEIESDDPYIEPTIAFLRNESFYWGWFEPTFSKSLFLNQSEKRVFLYNADYDSACKIHFYQNGSPFDSDGSDPWCNLAINAEPGYASCAGSVDNPGSDAFLRPRPFFEVLHRGGSLGEAFLAASPYLNWKTVLIGDPLISVIFPSDVPSASDPSVSLITNNEAIFQSKEFFEEGLAWAYRQSQLALELRDFVVQSDDINEQLELLYATATWENLKNFENQINLLASSVEQLIRYIQFTTGLTFTQWLSVNQFKTTELLNQLLVGLGGGSVQPDDEDELIHGEGFWEFSFVYNHLPKTFERVHFFLQLSTNSDFSGTVVNLSTLDDVTGWRYESEPFFFVQLSSDGFSSNFSGRRLKFSSPEDIYLNRADIFYVRWRAVKADGITFLTDWNIQDDVLIIKT